VSFYPQVEYTDPRTSYGFSNHPHRRDMVLDPNGDEIYIGPCNAQQAPTSECENCTTPITVGQLKAYIHLAVQGINVRTGQLVDVPIPEFPSPVQMHDDCTPEFCHDQITQEPCGQYSYECTSCGSEIELPDTCSYCHEKLSPDVD
jgi:hypothetical protein